MYFYTLKTALYIVTSTIKINMLRLSMTKFYVPVTHNKATNMTEMWDMIAYRTYIYRHSNYLKCSLMYLPQH